METKAGLWIDHRRAFIVYLEGEDIRTLNIESDMEKHVRASGGWRSVTPYGPQDILAEDRIDRKYGHHLDRYYEKVAEALGGVVSALVMGPGEARREFYKYMQKKGLSPKPVITMEKTDKMREKQIIERVKNYFSS